MHAPLSSRNPRRVTILAWHSPTVRRAIQRMPTPDARSTPASPRRIAETASRDAYGETERIRGKRMSDDSAGNGAAGGAQPSRPEGEEIIRLNEVYKIFGPQPQGRAFELARSGVDKNEVQRLSGHVVGLTDVSFSIIEARSSWSWASRVRASRLRFAPSTSFTTSPTARFSWTAWMCRNSAALTCRRFGERRWAWSSSTSPCSPTETCSTTSDTASKCKRSVAAAAAKPPCGH